MFTRGGRGVHAVKSGVWAGKVAFARAKQNGAGVLFRV